MNKTVIPALLTFLLLFIGCSSQQDKMIKDMSNNTDQVFDELLVEEGNWY